MPENWFQFRKFMVRQDEPVFRVGTDAVLLGAWTDVDGVRSVLDIGTGTGLLALMMAQRTEARITAVEIDEASCRQAHINFKASPWNDRISLFNKPIQAFRPGTRYDLIICNPPFFQDSMLPRTENLTFSKHNISMGLPELATEVSRLLNPHGWFSTVLPTHEGMKFRSLMEENGLYVHRMLKIRPKPQMEGKRLLLEFRSSRDEDPHTDEIVIEKSRRHEYTEDYRELTRDFYLGF